MGQELTDLLRSWGSAAGPSGYPQLNNYALVLRHGRDYRPQPLPARYPRMQPRHCFFNSQRLVDRDRRLRYVEGYAAVPGGIPTLHAWCVLAGSDRVIEPTCADFVEYRGLAFRRSFLRRHAAPGACLSLLDNWEAGWPVLRLADEELARVTYKARARRVKGPCP